MLKIKLAATIVFLILITAAFWYSRGGFLVSKESMSTPKNLIAAATLPSLPVEEKAPTLIGIAGWINSKPLLADDLRGKVVLVDFWTYSCINCIRTLPHINEWYRKYRDNGFVVLGVHSPEFEFEKKKENVEEAVKKYGLEYPVALDSDHATWNAFGNQYWPAHYLIDVNGNIRYHSFGEGHYAETESAIQRLLLEANLLGLDKITEVKEPPPDADYKNFGTPEIYLGYLRINNIGNLAPDVRANTPHEFLEPDAVQENRFYLAGNWKIGPEAAELVGDTGKIIIRYKAGRMNMVLGNADNKAVALEVMLDGHPPGEKNKGQDVVVKNGRALVTVDTHRLYNLVDTDNDHQWHTVEIRMSGQGLLAFTFTFG